MAFVIPIIGELLVGEAASLAAAEIVDITVAAEIDAAIGVEGATSGLVSEAGGSAGGWAFNKGYGAIAYKDPTRHMRRFSLPQDEGVVYENVAQTPNATPFVPISEDLADQMTSHARRPRRIPPSDENLKPHQAAPTHNEAFAAGYEGIVRKDQYIQGMAINPNDGKPQTRFPIGMGTTPVGFDVANIPYGPLPYGSSQEYHKNPATVPDNSEMHRFTG